MQRSIRFALAAGMAGLLGLACAVTPAGAQTQSFSFLSLANYDAVHISFDGGANTEYVAAGRYNGSLSTSTAGHSVYIFCTDATHWQQISPYTTLTTLGAVSQPVPAGGPFLTNVSGGKYFYTTDATNSIGAGLASAIATPGDYHALSLTSNSNVTGSTNAAINANARASAVAYLTDQFLNAASFSVVSGSTNLTDNLAAVQIAIWKVVQDGFGTGSLSDVTSFGSVRLVNGVSANLVNYYYNTVASAHTDYVGVSQWIQAPRSDTSGSHTFNGQSSQDFAFTPVPEPAFFQLAALLGLGGIGMLRIRRKQRASLSVASAA